MGATSVTGTGQGISNGLQKPELHSGCFWCGHRKKPVIPQKAVKVGCSTKYSTANLVRYKNSSGSPSYKGC